MKKIPDQILNCFHNNQRFLILLHQKPDGDAIGSAVALGKGLKRLDKTVDYYIDLPLEDKLVFFNEIQYFNTGSCIHPDCITCIEIVNSEISLVKWDIKTKEDRTVYVDRELLAVPRKV